MSTAFAPTSHLNGEAGDEQPHHDLPPPLHLQNGPFTNQLNPSTAQYASSPPQNTHRPVRPLRQDASNGVMASANGNGQPMPVPGGRINGHGHAANLREMGFAGPRSPPSNKSRQREIHYDVM